MGKISTNPKSLEARERKAGNAAAKKAAIEKAKEDAFWQETFLFFINNFYFFINNIIYIFIFEKLILYHKMCSTLHLPLLRKHHSYSFLTIFSLYQKRINMCQITYKVF